MSTTNIVIIYKTRNVSKLLGKKGPLLGKYLVETLSCPLEAPPPPPWKIKNLHGSVRVTIPRIIRSAIRYQGWGVGIINMIALCIAIYVAFQACPGNMVSLRYSPNPIKWGPPNRIKFPLRFLPFLCFFLFFLSSPRSLLLAAGLPCFLPFFRAQSFYLFPPYNIIHARYAYALSIPICCSQ